MALTMMAGCRTIPVAETEGQRTPIEKGVATIPAKPTWVLKPGGDAFISYTLQQEASVVSHSPTERVQKLSPQIVEFSLHSSGPDHNQVTELTVSSITRDKEKSEVVPFSISALNTNSFITTSVIATQKSEESICSHALFSIVPSTSTAILALPLTITKGMTWSDSMTTSACAGPIPTKSTIVRQYQALGEDDGDQNAGILISLDQKTLTTGEGSDGQHRVYVNATGIGKGQLTIDAVDGSLLRATVEEKSSIRIMVSGTGQDFEQVVTKTITRRHQVPYRY